jgi:uncharacterized membrane protein
MTNRPIFPNPLKLGHPLFVMFLCLLALFVALLWPAVEFARAMLIGFDLAAAAFAFAVCARMGRRRAELLRVQARRNDAGRGLMLVLAAILTLVVLIVVGVELRHLKGAAATEVTLIAVTLLLAWLFANLVYALHYAHIYYDSIQSGADRAGLLFPGTAEPDFWDFCYFAFVLGSTFQVSDVQIVSARIRRAATLHGLTAFLFNMGIVALTVNIVASAT